MPYLVYRVSKDRSAATLIDEFDAFKPASKFAKAERVALTPSDGIAIKVIHADDVLEGERLAKEFRQPSWPVEEWE